MGFKQYQVY